MDHIKNADMGCLFTKMLSWLSLGKGPSSLPAPLPVGVLLCGLSRSGKSSVLYRLKLGSFIPTMATLGVVQEQVDLQQAAPPPGSAPRTWRMQVFDVGRPDLARGGQCWQQYIKVRKYYSMDGWMDTPEAGCSNWCLPARFREATDGYQAATRP
eukprot:GHVU01034213.1.p1 GENE.GHVU01034213.1~~GHVU01034213.1.p1  ORF type:complete len:154 (+),score=15.03 GHVU01034213.1:106-567(+)